MSCQDIVLIQQLICLEREARDRGWWEEMRNAFSPAAIVKVSWYQGDAMGFIEESIQSAKGGIRSKHKLGPVIVRTNGSKALATVGATIEARTIINGTEADLVSDVTLLYRVAKDTQGQWRIVYLTCIYDKDKLIPVLPGAGLTLNETELSGYRPSYRFLSFVIEQKQRRPVSKALAGEDRPAEVKKVYDECDSWVRGSTIEA
jgi:hypothetical protein